MIRVDTVYDLVNDLLSKNNGVAISPLEFDRYALIASNSLYDDYRGANTSSRVTYGANRTLDSRLKPFVVHDYKIVLNGAGYGELPLDWAQTLTVKTSSYEPIRPIDEDRVAIAVSGDPYTKPSAQSMVYEDIFSSTLFPHSGVGSIKVHPSGAESSVILTYLRKPVNPKYGFNLVGRRPVYTEGLSTHFDWGSSQLGEIVFRILQLAGVSMDKMGAIQFASIKQNEE